MGWGNKSLFLLREMVRLLYTVVILIGITSFAVNVIDLAVWCFLNFLGQRCFPYMSDNLSNKLKNEQLCGCSG